MAGAEAGDAGQFLVFLDQGIGFAGNFGRRDLHLDFPLGVATGFSGAHVCLSVCPPAAQESVPDSDRPKTTGVQS